MATSLRLIFWGWVLVLLDVRLDTVDALPDFAGYAMLAIGAGRLAGEAPGFRAARRVAWAMVVPGLLDAVVPLQGAAIPGVVETLGQAALLWTLLTGIADWTAAGGRPDLARPARTCRAASLALLAVGLAAGIFTWSGQSAGLAVVLVFLNLLLMLLVLSLIHRVGAALEPEAGLPRAPRPAAYPPRG